MMMLKKLLKPPFLFSPLPFLQYPLFGFSAQQKLLYGTDTPAKSNRHMRGLYHGLTHAKRY